MGSWNNRTWRSRTTASPRAFPTRLFRSFHSVRISFHFHSRTISLLKRNRFPRRVLSRGLASRDLEETEDSLRSHAAINILMSFVPARSVNMSAEVRIVRSLCDSREKIFWRVSIQTRSEEH